ncbi:DNA cytosine methyltransferase [Streptomyces sp. YIM 98790]|uniref:DNA cytosine methyltransferase n=1 Tax=Streptomyces sp. YIM 98790 TaxID=2689077 RepID=UPI00140A0D3A|nr:DNA cytosine methyltransferase [Streptomyces sp. YIM 98790]
MTTGQRWIVDLFAGAGGWSQGLRHLGARDVGLEWDRWACATRAAAGHLTIRTDVAAYPTHPFAGRTRGVIASPPCQAWSAAGKRLGLLDQPYVHQAVADLAAGRDTRAKLLTSCRDDRSLLAAEPMRYLHTLNRAGEPEWVAMEEVPDVLPLWKQYAAILRTWGFSVWTGILNAADYGVPQTRKRAILLASRTRTAAPPPPTHAALAERDTLFGPGRAKWVSMAQALGWGATDRPVPTVCAGGTDGGGPEPFPTGSRQTLTDARARGTWKPPSPGHRTPPAPRRNRTGWFLRSNNQANATIRHADEPAGTLFFGHRANECVWVPQAATGTDSTDPAPPEPIRITAAEAGVLQSFPRRYPWRGNKGQIFSQIGNAVPPRLGAHLLAEHIGATVCPDDFSLAA